MGNFFGISGIATKLLVKTLSNIPYLMRHLHGWRKKKLIWQKGFSKFVLPQRLVTYNKFSRQNSKSCNLKHNENRRHGRTKPPSVKKVEYRPHHTESDRTYRNFNYEHASLSLSFSLWRRNIITYWDRIRRGRYLFAGEFNLVFLERDKSPIQRRVSRKPRKSTLGKLNVGTASTVRSTNQF